MNDWIDFDWRRPPMLGAIQVRTLCVHAERDGNGEWKRVETERERTAERIEGGFMIDGVGWFDDDDDGCAVIAWRDLPQPREARDE